MSDYRKSMVAYYSFVFFARMTFFTPIITLFFQKNNLSMSEIYALEAVYALIVVLLEVPTGAIADHFGCRNSLISGALFTSAGAAILFFGKTFNQFLLSEIIWAVGASMISGSDSAYIYNTLSAHSKESNFKKVIGYSEMIGMTGAGIATLFGGFMANYSFRLTMIATALAFVVSAFTLFRAEEPPKAMKCDTKYWARVFESFKFIKRHRLVRWLLVYLAFLVTGGTILFWVYQPYLKMTGLPLAMFGIVFVFFQAVSGLSARFSYTSEKILGFNKSLIALGILFLVPFFFMAFFAPKWGFLVILLHQAVRGSAKPIIQHKVLRYTWENKRATVLSISSLLSRLSFMLLAPAFGVVVDAYGLQIALMQAGIAVFAILSIGFILYLLIPQKYFRIKANSASR